MSFVFDIRKSTTQQLSEILGQHSLSAFDIEFTLSIKNSILTLIFELRLKKMC